MARTSSKILKAIPNSEIIKVDCLNGKYLITQNPLKEQFTLWKCLEDDEGGFERIDVANNPLDFDDIIPWESNTPL